MTTSSPRTARESTRATARRLFAGVGSRDAARDAADALVPTLGSWCEVCLLEQGELRPVEVRGGQEHAAPGTVPTSFPDLASRRGEVLAGDGTLALQGSDSEV